MRSDSAGDYQSTGMVADEAVHAHHTLPGKASLGLSDIQRNHAAQQWARLQHLAPQVHISIAKYFDTAVWWLTAVSCSFAGQAAGDCPGQLV